jgi:hypothetical protein
MLQMRNMSFGPDDKRQTVMLMSTFAFQPAPGSFMRRFYFYNGRYNGVCRGFCFGPIAWHGTAGLRLHCNQQQPGFAMVLTANPWPRRQPRASLDLRGGARLSRSSAPT